MEGAGTIVLITRYLVAAAVAAAVVVALVYWAVRRGKLNAFGPVARATRRVADPFVRPVERRILRWGGNPQDAPLWLIGIILVVGLVLTSLISWLTGIISRITHLADESPRAWISFAVSLAYSILVVALLLRVLGSWVGVGRYNRWMRYAYLLTDWLVEPIRRMLPGFGMIDFSPLLAWLALYLFRYVVLAGLFRI